MVKTTTVIDYMDEELICLDLLSKTKDEMLHELSRLMEISPNIEGGESMIYNSLLEREKIGSTGIGKGVAIPHAKTEIAKKLTIAFGIAKNKVDFNSLDNEGVNIFFAFASPQKESQVYLKILARISRLVRNEEFRNTLLKCKTPKEVIEYIKIKELEI